MLFFIFSETSSIFGLALMIRVITSMTYAHWFHPDEWCQTLEPANLIAHGFGFHSQEVGLHLRNLSWPALLALPLQGAQAISGHSIRLRIFSVNLFCGLLDLLILWGWMQLLFHTPKLKSLSQQAKNWSLTLLLFPWFALYGSINPRGEHLSEIAFWAALGCLANQFWFLTGFATVAIFAFRYPSILLSVGIGLSIILQALRHRSAPWNFNFILEFIFGLFVGLLFFGIADWVFYGRPWESFWMYLQYNLFTGSGARTFGEQGISTYGEIFLWNWTTYRLLIPLGIVFFFSGIYGLWNGLKNQETWAICLIIYLLGHLLVPHKEGRFMAPIETLTRWAAFTGIIRCLPFKKIPFKKFGMIALWFFLITNGFIFLHHLRGDLWKDLGTYLELGAHLNTHPRTCAILTSRFVHSVLLPFHESQSFPQPALASFRTDLDHLSYEATQDSDLSWVEHPPECHTGDSVLLHSAQAESQWNQKENCQLLASGALKLIPFSYWNWAIHHHLAKGAWYVCPPEIFSHFRSQKVQHQYSHQFGKIKTLPAYGISALELEKLGRQTSPPPQDAVLPRLLN